jgi:hypothetical protein
VLNGEEGTANMYAWGLLNIATEAAHLSYLSDELKAGRDRKDIIESVRKLRKKK